MFDGPDTWFVAVKVPKIWQRCLIWCEENVFNLLLFWWAGWLLPIDFHLFQNPQLWSTDGPISSYRHSFKKYYNLFLPNIIQVLSVFVFSSVFLMMELSSWCNRALKDEGNLLLILYKSSVPSEVGREKKQKNKTRIYFYIRFCHCQNETTINITRKWNCYYLLFSQLKLNLSTSSLCLFWGK